MIQNMQNKIWLYINDNDHSFSEPLITRIDRQGVVARLVQRGSKHNVV